MPRIAIVTLAVGADYTKAMEPGLASKRRYAAKHGYDLHVGGAEVWDRSRPIPWTKLQYILKFVDDYDYIFWSDADVLLMNEDLTLEQHVLPRLPPSKDLLWTKDICGNLNSGNMLIRGRSAWIKDLFARTYAQTDLIHHIWWENAAMIRMITTNAEDAAKTETLDDSTLFNSYLFGSQNKASTNERLYRSASQDGSYGGDFLIHFAGVSDQWTIYKMMKYMESCKKSRTPHSTHLLDAWYSMPPRTQKEADAELATLHP